MSTELRATLEAHLQQRLANHPWVASCLAGQVNAFPFRLQENGKATIGQLSTPQLQTAQQVKPLLSTRTFFVINIPMGVRPAAMQSSTKYSAMLARIRDQAFDAAQSKRIVKQRVVVVVGVNQVCSIDRALNRSFRKWIADLPAVNGIEQHCVGFTWSPKWEKQSDDKLIHSLSNTFLLLKVLNASLAESVRVNFEMGPTLRTQIPFQLIREAIKNAAPTRSAVERLQERGAVYLTVMDADFLNLNGVFGQMLPLIASKGPSVISPGYRVAASELPLIRLGVKLDMAVRRAVSLIFPYGAYFPEPCTAFRVRADQLRLLSFRGAGRVLENRRLIENGRRHQILGDNVAFMYGGEVVTATPERMYTDKNRRILTLSKQQIKQKQCLEALRFISQTHATPKQWADNLYAGLDFSCSCVSDATQHMMHIFGVFDPISRMYAAGGRYSAKVFDKVMADYEKPLADRNTLDTAKTQLRILGMSRGMVDKIELAAKMSGLAIYQTLKEAVS